MELEVGAEMPKRLANINRNHRGQMILGGQTLYVLEVQPAACAALGLSQQSLTILTKPAAPPARACCSHWPIGVNLG